MVQTAPDCRVGRRRYLHVDNRFVAVVGQGIRVALHMAEDPRRPVARGGLLFKRQRALRCNGLSTGIQDRSGRRDESKQRHGERGDVHAEMLSAVRSIVPGGVRLPAGVGEAYTRHEGRTFAVRPSFVF